MVLITRYPRPNSDCAGINVAARNEDRKSPRSRLASVICLTFLVELQIEVFSYYNKMDYEPVTQLSPAAYEKWVTTITMGWLTRKSVSCWSKIKMASALNEKMSEFSPKGIKNMI